jgi:hypothetical protein
MERRWLALVALALFSWALFVAPVGELPRSANSWDPLHSGRRFAEAGFLANRLQPVWAPPNARAPYLTYTHYPPLPYWIAGVVDVVVRDPFARIEAALRLVLGVGLGALLCGYAFLRRLAFRPASALLALGALVWSGLWWRFASGELSWVSWLQLFQLGSAAALACGLGAAGRARGRSLGLALLCALLGALSAFDAWPWFPTLFAVLACFALRSSSERLRPLLLATALATAASLAGVATRVAINTWHFGSLERVLQDAEEAYAARRTYAHARLEIAENRTNYMELPQREAAPHSAWVVELLRSSPERMASLFLPEAPPARAALACAALLALLGAWLARRRQGPAPWPGRAAWLLALTGAALPFALLSPALAVQQWGPLLAFAPAALLTAALVAEGALGLAAAGARALLAAGGRRLGTAPAHAATLAFAAALVFSIVHRTPPAPSPGWPVPRADCLAAVAALASLEGVVFVDLDDVNPLMFLVPRASGLALKPIWTQKLYLSDVRPLRILRIAGQGKLSERELAKLVPAPLPGLPGGFELLVPAARR